MEANRHFCPWQMLESHPRILAACSWLSDSVASIERGHGQLLGTVKFLGTTEFAAGEWLGIELDEKATWRCEWPSGSCAGTERCG